MRVRVLYFGVLKDFFGDAADVGLPDGADVAALLVQHQDRGNFVWESIAVAVNREYASAGMLLRDGDEVALLPPVSGGSCAHYCWPERGEILRRCAPQNDNKFKNEASEEDAD